VPGAGLLPLATAFLLVATLTAAAAQEPDPPAAPLGRRFPSGLPRAGILRFNLLWAVLRALLLGGLVVWPLAAASATATSPPSPPLVFCH
jgi:hypothetical protein